MANEQRLIDANELDKKLESLAKKYAAQGRFEAAKDYSFVQTVLLSAPTVDAVEVVRCKDCFADGCCSVQIDLDMGGYGYCPKGKRRCR